MATSTGLIAAARAALVARFSGARPDGIRLSLEASLRLDARTVVHAVRAGDRCYLIACGASGAAPVGEWQAPAVQPGKEPA